MPASEDLPELLRRLRELEDGSPEREEYLARIAAEIHDGTYRVDAEELARKLLREFST